MDHGADSPRRRSELGRAIHREKRLLLAGVVSADILPSMLIGNHRSGRAVSSLALLALSASSLVLLPNCGGAPTQTMDMDAGAPGAESSSTPATPTASPTPPAAPPAPAATPDAGADASASARCSGDGWCDVTLPTAEVAALEVPATGDSAFFALSGDRIATWSASATDVTTRPFEINAFWRESSAQLWAAGDQGFASFDGKAWTNATVAKPAGAKPNTAVPAVAWRDVAAVTSTTAIAVGDKGNAAWFSKGTWELTATGFAQNLNGVWAASATSIFAVGDAGTLIHYDGARWGALAYARPTGETAANIRFLKIWGATAKDIWAVGEMKGGNGIVLRFNGTRWEDVAAPKGQWVDVQGAPGVVFIVGENGAIARFDGKTWSTEKGVFSKRLNAVRLVGNTVWAAGLDGVERRALK
jgi:hypothetical protein